MDDLHRRRSAILPSNVDDARFHADVPVDGPEGTDISDAGYPAEAQTDVSHEFGEWYGQAHELPEDESWLSHVVSALASALKELPLDLFHH